MRIERYRTWQSDEYRQGIAVTNWINAWRNHQHRHIPSATRSICFQPTAWLWISGNSVRTISRINLSTNSSRSRKIIAVYHHGYISGTRIIKEGSTGGCCRCAKNVIIFGKNDRKLCRIILSRKSACVIVWWLSTYWSAAPKYTADTTCEKDSTVDFIRIN